jgi:hypothetical protein
MIGPTAQRERINAWMAARGHHLAIVHENLDVNEYPATSSTSLGSIERAVTREIRGGVDVKRPAVVTEEDAGAFALRTEASVNRS